MGYNNNMIYYYNECSTCKNNALKIVRDVSLEAVSLGYAPVDERFVAALPLWQSEAGDLMAGKDLELPFLYDMAANRILPLPRALPKSAVGEWREIVREFWLG